MYDVKSTDFLSVLNGRNISIPHPGTIVDQMQYDDLKGLKICFINMPLRESAKPNTPPQGPGLMASRLRMYGASPTIIDLNAYRIKDDVSVSLNLKNGRLLTYEEANNLIIKHFNKHGMPDIIALSGMITTLRWQEKVASICREISRESFIITGGGLATEIKAGLFNWIPDIDAVAHSEGDDIILIVARDIKRLKDHRGSLRDLEFLSDSPYYLGNLNGRNLFLYGGNRPMDLDKIPFAAWDLLHEDVFGNKILEWYIATPVWGVSANNSSATSFSMNRSLTTVSSRGCPYSCRFCFRGAQGERNYGMRSPENIRAEALWLKKEYDIDFLGFPDDNFAVNTKRIMKLPEALGDLNLRWGTHTRLDEADERASYMAQAGCVYIGFGAESASAAVLESMGKGGFILRPKGSSHNMMTHINGFDFPLTMVNGIRKCHEVGIHANCTWIMGYPGETLKDLQISVGFMKWQREEVTRGITASSPEYNRAMESINTRMFVATAYPGTEMCRNPKVQEILKNNFNLSFRNDGCTSEIIVNEELRQYILELDDATKVLYDKSGKPLYFGEMSEGEFLQAREYVDSGMTEEILSM